jgi:hypothetical protein
MWHRPRCFSYSDSAVQHLAQSTKLDFAANSHSASGENTFRAEVRRESHPFLSRFKAFERWQAGWQGCQNSVETTVSPVKERAGHSFDTVHTGLMNGLIGVDDWLHRAGRRPKAK